MALGLEPSLDTLTQEIPRKPRRAGRSTICMTSKSSTTDQLLVTDSVVTALASSLDVCHLVSIDAEKYSTQKNWLPCPLLSTLFHQCNFHGPSSQEDIMILFLATGWLWSDQNGGFMCGLLIIKPHWKVVAGRAWYRHFCLSRRVVILALLPKLLFPCTMVMVRILRTSIQDPVRGTKQQWKHRTVVIEENFVEFDENPALPRNKTRQESRWQDGFSTLFFWSCFFLFVRLFCLVLKLWL